jgi:hypothetical protein
MNVSSDRNPFPGQVLWILERGRIQRRLSDREEALRDFNYVAAIWETTDDLLSVSEHGLAGNTYELRCLGSYLCSYLELWVVLKRFSRICVRKPGDDDLVGLVHAVTLDCLCHEPTLNVNAMSGENGFGLFLIVCKKIRIADPEQANNV